MIGPFEKPRCSLHRCACPFLEAVELPLKIGAVEKNLELRLIFRSIPDELATYAVAGSLAARRRTGTDHGLDPDFGVGENEGTSDDLTIAQFVHVRSA